MTKYIIYIFISAIFAFGILFLSSCLSKTQMEKDIEIRGKMDALENLSVIKIEKAKERTVIVINNADTILNYTTTSDTIVIKLKIGSYEDLIDVKRLEAAKIIFDGELNAAKLMSEGRYSDSYRKELKRNIKELSEIKIDPPVIIERKGNWSPVEMISRWNP